MAKLRIFLVVFFLVGVAVLIVFPYRTKDAVGVAFLGNLSGNGFHDDISACNGAIQAADAINDRGGIKGQQLKLHIFDYKGRPEKIAEICSRIKGKRLGLLLAPYLPEVSLQGCLADDPILPLRFESQLPGTKNGGTISLRPLVGSCGSSLAGLAKIREIRRMTVLYDTETFPFGASFLEGFRRGYGTGGGRFLDEVAFDSSGLNDLTSLTALIEQTAPGAVLIVASAEITGRLARMVRKAWPSIGLYAAPWAFTEGLASSEKKPGSGKITGLEGLCTYALSADPLQADGFFPEYRKRYGASADLSALFGYEALLILADGIRNSASPDPFLVRHTLEKLVRFKGLVSDYTLGQEDLDKGDVFLLEVRGGMIVRPD